MLEETGRLSRGYGELSTSTLEELDGPGFSFLPFVGVDFSATRSLLWRDRLAYGEGLPSAPERLEVSYHWTAHANVDFSSLNFVVVDFRLTAGPGSSIDFSRLSSAILEYWALWAVA